MRRTKSSALAKVKTGGPWSLPAAGHPRLDGMCSHKQPRLTLRKAGDAKDDCGTSIRACVAGEADKKAIYAQSMGSTATATGRKDSYDASSGNLNQTTLCVTHERYFQPDRSCHSMTPYVAA